MQALYKALNQLRSGGMIVLVDDEDRENEGDIVIAAEYVTHETINFMATHARGLICLALTDDQVDRLALPPMVANNRAKRSTAFTVSIEAVDGITTGISAFDRARTIRIAADPLSTPDLLASPGHVFPLRSAKNGVLSRNGHTEGSVDLMKLAGLQPAAAICEVMRDDGRMAQREDLEVFAEKHGLPIITIGEIVSHRLAHECHVDVVARSKLPTSYSPVPFDVIAFRSRLDSTEHLALVRGSLSGAPLVRIHSECLTGDALGSLRCDCGPQLQESLRQISTSDGGVLVYLRGHEGRGIGLANKISAYALQDRGHDTVEANTALGFPPDARDYSIAGQILRVLDVTRMRLLTNNPEKVLSMKRFGIQVTEQLSLVVPNNPYNYRYLETKRDRFGHTFFERKWVIQNA